MVLHEEVAKGFVDVRQAGRVARVAAFGEPVFPAFDRLDDVGGDVRSEAVLLVHEEGEGVEILLRGEFALFGEGSSLTSKSSRKERSLREASDWRIFGWVPLGCEMSTRSSSSS